ncbi:hypothetical protein ABK040_015033 [Willaertia magna]
MKRTILTLAFVAIIGVVFALAGGEEAAFGGFPGANGYNVNGLNYYSGQGTNFGTNAANYNNYNQNTQAYNNQVSATSYTPYSNFGAAYQGPYANNYAASQYYNPVIYGGFPYGGYGAPFIGGGFGYGAGFGAAPFLGGAGFGYGAGVGPFF